MPHREADEFSDAVEVQFHDGKKEKELSESKLDSGLEAFDPADMDSGDAFEVFERLE